MSCVKLCCECSMFRHMVVKGQFVHSQHNLNRHLWKEHFKCEHCLFITQLIKDTCGRPSCHLFSIHPYGWHLTASIQPQKAVSQIPSPWLGTSMIKGMWYRSWPDTHSYATEAAFIPTQRKEGSNCPTKCFFIVSVQQSSSRVRQPSIMFNRFINWGEFCHISWLKLQR